MKRSWVWVSATTPCWQMLPGRFGLGLTTVLWTPVLEVSGTYNNDGTATVLCQCFMFRIASQRVLSMLATYKPAALKTLLAGWDRYLERWSSIGREHQSRRFWHCWGSAWLHWVLRLDHSTVSAPCPNCLRLTLALWRSLPVQDGRRTRSTAHRCRVLPADTSQGRR